MKKIIALILTLCALGATIYFLDPLTNYLADKVSKNPDLVIKYSNLYAKDKDYLFVQRSKDFVPYSYQDLLNIIYSTINNGWQTFTFYCPEEYVNCLKDMEDISKDELIYTHINNYVHPFNSFTKVSTIMSESGEITLEVNFLYTAEEIEKIDAQVNKIIKEIINDDMEVYDKIKVIHDYIANHSKYDVEKNNNGQSKYHSNTAYGPLFEGFATCNGYTDLMAIFLSKIGVDNYKIATTPDKISYSKTGHVWNAVKVNDEWLHLDLTWDDPVSVGDNKDYLFHTYFLVNNEAMAEADKGETVLEEHNFAKKFYLEFK